MILSGHSEAVHCLKFSPDGTVLASGSKDKCIFLWRIFDYRCENYMMLKGHQNAVLDIHFVKNGECLVSSSTDNTIDLWDAQTGKKINKMNCKSLVNSCCPEKTRNNFLVSGSDDGCSRVWDIRVKEPILTIQEQYPITAVAFAHTGSTIYSGGIDNRIKIRDLRNLQTVLTLEAHIDTITGLRVSPNGAYLLSNSMDNSLSLWDIQGNANGNRLVKTFTGHICTEEQDLLKCNWSPDGSRVSAGSGDHNVYIWDVGSRQLLYNIPGHRGPVIEVVFHPHKPIIGSCSIDKNIYLGEIVH
jgi:Prp8 binding protein